MGCAASKAAGDAAVANKAAGTNNNNNNKLSTNTTSPQKTTGSSNTPSAITKAATKSPDPARPVSPSPPAAAVKKKKSFVLSPKQQQQKQPEAPVGAGGLVSHNASMQTTTAASSTAPSRKSYRSYKRSSKSSSGDEESENNKSNKSNNVMVYKLLAKVQQRSRMEQEKNNNTNSNNVDLKSVGSNLTAQVEKRILTACQSTPAVASYQNPTTKSTPLHMAVRLLDFPTTSERGGSLPAVVQGLIRANPDAVRFTDAAGHVPLHYAMAPTTVAKDGDGDEDNSSTTRETQLDAAEWKIRAEVLQILLAADIDSSMEYLQQPEVAFEGAAVADGGVLDATVCTPFYRALHALPDDFDRSSPTVVFSAVLKEACPAAVEIPNQRDGDTPLALLYRRFTRQFDLAEKFFAGDNSRPEVVEHRRKYKTAAGNTWKIIECLLRPELPSQPPNHPIQWRLLHRAVQLQTPPDLLRYIVETNAEDLQQADQSGNLPLHYASQATNTQVYYSKFVTDELLYKYPESASVPNGEGQLPLTLAIQAKKPWIGGGLQSLYDAYPAALEHVDLKRHDHLRKVFSDIGSFAGGPLSPTGASPEEKKTESNNSSSADEPHDAIMLVQQKDVPVQHVVNAMWAHEEDAGLQMLACVALARQIRQEKDSLLRIALPAVSAVVNAMKAHPNEVIVQEKASHVLSLLAGTDGQRELSFVASGAVAALVGALQAHVSDSSVQEEASGALAAIVQAGGADRATIVASVSGLTALVNALAAHPDSVGVQREACRALACILPFGESANLPTLCRSQTEPLLQSAASQFPVECGPWVEKLLPLL